MISPSLVVQLFHYWEPEAFSRVLDTAGLCDGRQLNFNEIASDVQVPPRTVREYFQLIEDTLIGKMLPPFTKTKRRKAVASPKFYLFDHGVARYLRGTVGQLPLNESLGEALEDLVFLELSAYLSYNSKQESLSYFRTHSKHEVDFIIGDSIAIEVRAKERVTQRDTTNLLVASEEIPSLSKKIIICRESRYLRLESGIELYPILDFLDALWNGDIF